jgi:nucleoid-associated protein YgaU
MRKDVKTGMLVGTGLCLAVAVWFCVHQQIVEQPRIEFLPPQDDLETEAVPKTIATEAKKPSAVKTEILRVHTVQPGQTLSDISKIYYGTNAGWKKIYEANKESLPRGPDTIRAGMKIAIPE